MYRIYVCQKIEKSESDKIDWGSRPACGEPAEPSNGLRVTMGEEDFLRTRE